MKIFGKKKKDEKIEEKPPAAVKNSVEQSGPRVELPKGEDAQAYRVILNPHLSEKASTLGSLNQYVFRVSDRSNKIQIKQAVEKLYKVKVRKVAVARLPAKYRRLGRHEGYKPGFKKAIVTLATGDKIEVAT